MFIAWLQRSTETPLSRKSPLTQEEVLLVSSTEETVVQRAVQYQAELESLSSTLSSAVSDEDYRLAASTRDRINLMGLQDPVAMLQSSLDRAVAEERYQGTAWPQPRTRANAAARLELDVSAGWASPSSHGHAAPFENETLGRVYSTNEISSDLIH